MKKLILIILMASLIGCSTQASRRNKLAADYPGYEVSMLNQRDLISLLGSKDGIVIIADFNCDGNCQSYIIFDPLIHEKERK